MRWLIAHVKAHALIFEPKPRSAYPPAAGLRLLLVFLVLEVVLGPRLTLPARFGVPEMPLWIRVPAMLATALTLIRWVAGVRLGDIGLYGWRQWSASEKSYLAHMIPLALGIFTFMSLGRIRALMASSAGVSLALAVGAYFVWGFYQELMYRGILQTELSRRWGRTAGILISNAAYVFGPLHLYYWSIYSRGEALAMFGAVFAIGLYFGVLFQRSGNLWLPAVLHGIGDVFLTGLSTRS